MPGNDGRDKITKKMRYRMTAVFYLLSVLLLIVMCRQIFSNNKTSPYLPATAVGESSCDQNAAASSFPDENSSGHLHPANQVDTNEWQLVLSNKTHPLPENYQVELTSFNDESQNADKRCASKLFDMLDAAQADGIELYVASSYRSLERQKVLFDQEYQDFLDKGYDQKAAYKAAAVYQAPPGTSEHATGLAFDIVDGDWFSEHDNLNEKFDKTKAFAWLSQHAADYGFILRYPKDKCSVTQYGYEPWHYRFVGIEHAQKIKKQGICLEEYLNILD